MKDQNTIYNIQESKLYELALDMKLHAETRRDEISKFYITLFTAIISIIPFISNITNKSDDQPKGYIVNILVISLSLSGIALSMNWIFILKRTVNVLNGIEKFIIGLERKHDAKFILFLNEYLDKVDNKSEGITKQELWIPYLFVILFTSSLIFSIKFMYF